MRRRRSWRASALCLALGGLAAAAGADEPAPDAAPPAVDPRAMAVLTRMLDALGSVPSLHVRVEEEYDVVRESGDTLSFGRVSDVTLRRPDRLRIEVTEDGGAQRVFSADGRHVVLLDRRENWFAAAERGSDLDGALAFLQDDAGVELAMAPLFSSRLRELLLEDVTSAHLVARKTLDGEELDHIALRYGDVGLQLWVPAAGYALPRRLSLRFDAARGSPRLRADFREWDLEPHVPDAVFAFDPPEGVRAVPFALPKPADAVAERRRGAASGGLLSLERAKSEARNAEAAAAARDTAARLAQAASRPRSGRPVVKRTGITTPATTAAPADSIAAAPGDESAGPSLGRPIGSVLRPGAFEQMTQQPDCALFQIEHAGARYSRCGDTWYVEALAGGEIRYVVVEPPPGYAAQAD